MKNILEFKKICWSMSIQWKKGKRKIEGIERFIKNNGKMSMEEQGKGKDPEEL